MGNQNREIGTAGVKSEEGSCGQPSGRRKSVLAAHRHLFAKELRGNFVSEDSGTVALQPSAISGSEHEAKTRDIASGEDIVGTFGWRLAPVERVRAGECA